MKPLNNTPVEVELDPIDEMARDIVEGLETDRRTPTAVEARDVVERVTRDMLADELKRRLRREGQRD